MLKIATKQMVTDIRAGLGDDQLMAKYELPRKLFQRILQRLVAEEAIKHEDLYDKSATYRHINDVLLSRRHPRVYVPMAIRVYDDSSSQIGFIRDISENGLRVAGIEAKVGETRTLSLPLREIPTIGPVRCEMTCRWSEKKGNHKEFAVSGFEVTSGSEEARRRLLQLIDYLRHHGKTRHQGLKDRVEMPESSGSTTETKLSSGSREFSGTMDGIDILDLVHFLLLNRHNTVLEILSSDGDRCRLHVMDGKIVHAVGSKLEGRDAFFSCMNFPGGTFRTLGWQDPSKRTISESADFLLMEAARRRDEFSEHLQLSTQVNQAS